jgi:predicted ribosomally synthesized peptide with SipW-like signal peptide
MTRTKKALIGLLLIGALASIGVGTYASFTASITNNGNTFQDGTLFLGTAANATTSTCFSYGSAAGTAGVNSNSNACATSISLTNFKPGGSAQTFVLQLENAGSLPADVSLAGSCSAGTGATNQGSGSACSDMALTIQPCATYTGGATCTTKTATCLYPSAASACNIGTTPGSPGGVSVTNPILSNWAAASKQAYEIDVALPSAATNSDQGVAANFALTWSSVPH